MFDIDQWQEIFYTIRKNKLRTFLTAFSVAWGIFMLVLLLGAGRGLQNGVEYQFRDDATNSLFIRSGQTSIPYKGMNVGRNIQFTNADYETIKNTVQGVEHITSRFYLSGEYTVRYNDKYSSFNVRACHPDHLYLENTIMLEGRFLNDMDIEEKRKVTAIGTEIIAALFEPHEDPIGKWIDVNGIKYKVIGVYKDEGGENEVRTIYIPISTAQMAYGGANNVHQIMLTTGNASVEESKRIQEDIVNLLSERHNFSPEDPRAVFIFNMVEEFQQFVNLFLGIEIFLWIVGLGTITAGIVGVSNIMLIVVKERTREIGIRKAIGATPGSIVGLFLQESVLITVLAGYTGLVLGIGLVELINYSIINFEMDLEFFRNPEIDLGTATAATLLLILAGALAGYFPARKAAKINPIVALRDE